METSSFSTVMDEDNRCNVENVNGEGTCEDRPEESQREESPAPPKNTLRFMVENVESPKKTIPKAARESAEFSFPEHGETIGFSTHEAVPMTMFYRNASSMGENALQRPTLKELHEGFDMLDEEIVSFNGANIS